MKLKMMKYFILFFLSVGVFPLAAGELPATDSTHRALALSKWSEGGLSPAWKHAPLMAFSLGSLATAGVIYGIQQSSQSREDLRVSGRPADWNLALGFAGISALAAAGAYFHYVRRDNRARAQWSAALVPDSEGEPAFAAVLRLGFQAPGS
jgi:hypothetical protein